MFYESSGGCDNVPPSSPACVCLCVNHTFNCVCEGPCKHDLIAVKLRCPRRPPGLWELKPTLSAGTKGSPHPHACPLSQPTLPWPTSQQKGPRGLNSQATIQTLAPRLLRTRQEGMGLKTEWEG